MRTSRTNSVQAALPVRFIHHRSFYSLLSDAWRDRLSGRCVIIRSVDSSVVACLALVVSFGRNDAVATISIPHHRLPQYPGSYRSHPGRRPCRC